jgi:glycosyltransferase involved in cell wall biosynthesis
MSETVSVVIATYNRHEQCRRSIDSVLAQTHAPLEVIVVDDCSDVPFEDSRVTVLRTPQNTKAMFGWASPGYVRTLGMREAKGEYIAFLDDDDTWLPHKLETQLGVLRTSGLGACCSDAWIGRGTYDPTTQYQRMMSEHFFSEIKYCLALKRCFALDNGFPTQFSYTLLTNHNLVITSSAIVSRSILEAVGYMKTVPLGQEDYGCWLDISRHTDVAFVDAPCLFYDSTPSKNR